MGRVGVSETRVRQQPGKTALCYRCSEHDDATGGFQQVSDVFLFLRNVSGSWRIG